MKKNSLCLINLRAKKICKFLGDKHPAQAIVYFYLNELL